MDQLEARLVEFFGFECFRPGQREVIERLLQGQHTLAVLTNRFGEIALLPITGPDAPWHHARRFAIDCAHARSS